MKKFLFIILLLVLFFSSKGQQVNQKEAHLVAKAFLSQHIDFKDFRLKKIETLKEQTDVLAYVAILKPRGFILISTSKSLNPIFGYSTEGNFSFQKNTALSVIKSLLKKDKNSSIYFNDSLIRRNHQLWDKLLKEEGTKNYKDYDYQYGYWLKSVWGSVNCYDNNGQIVYVLNYYTPYHYSPGCVAVSMSQVLHYYKWPPRGTGTHTDYDNEGSSTGSYYAKFVATEYQWDKMLDEYYYKASTEEQRQAAGLLAYHCAIGTDMDFEYNGSTANINRIPNALMSYFRFVGHYEERSWSSFISRLQSNLRNAHPVILAARADNGDEHAFVCDGYRYNIGEDKYYHLNMGWWNAYGLNGWYRIFNNFNVGGYNTIISGVFDIIPRAYMQKAIYTSDPHKIILRWRMPKNVNVTAYRLEESYNNGSWTTISSSITDTFYIREVSADGLYKYRVKAQVDGIWYADTYSNYINVPIGNAVYLYFDGDDSFFAYDNIFNDLDVDSSWTFESWVEVDTYQENSWSVIMDRRKVFSLYLINDYDSDFAVRFVVRDNSDNIIASLRSDSSDINLSFGTWFHVAVSYDGTTAKLFINGKEVDQSQNPNFILKHSTNALNFAARYWGSYSRYLEGRLDEIRISDIARYTENFCPNRFREHQADKHTRLLLHLDNYTGENLYDDSHHILGITLRASPNDASWASFACPIIQKNPKSVASCGENVNFTIQAYNATNYQWQRKDIGEFYNLYDNLVYSGTSTDSLSVDASALYGTSYFRCLISNSKMFSCSETAYLKAFNNCTIWDGASWSNGIPNSDKTAVIEANYSVQTDINADNLIVKENDTLFILPDNTFTTHFIENKGVIFLKSNYTTLYSGSLIADQILNYGKFIAQKTLFAPHSQQEDNLYIFNSPLDSAYKFCNIWNENLKFLKNNGQPNIWQEIDSCNVPILPKKAYLVQTAIPQIINFEGNFNDQEIQFDLQEGWNLLYNPYPSVIDWNSPNGWTKIQTQNTIYTLNSENNSQNFSVYNSQTSINNGSRYINAMQGFFVYAQSPNAKLIIHPNAKIRTSAIEEENNILNNYIKFEFENSLGQKDQAVIYFTNTGQTSYKIMPISQNPTYTYIVNLGSLLSIAAFKPSNMDTIVDIGFKTAIAGQAVFKVKEFNFNKDVYLKDNLTGDTMKLFKNAEYYFNASSHEPLNRFKLFFGQAPNKIKTNQNIEFFYNKNILTVKTNGQATIEISDLIGRILFNKYFYKSFKINLQHKGIYLITIYTNTQKITKKIVIY